MNRNQGNAHLTRCALVLCATIHKELVYCREILSKALVLFVPFSCKAGMATPCSLHPSVDLFTCLDL